MTDEQIAMPAYDHNVKAGNEGDICKHPAPIAALDRTIADSVTPMRYGDVFAGYATNPLDQGKSCGAVILNVCHKNGAGVVHLM